MTIQVDTREKPKAIEKIIAHFDREGIKHFRAALPVGDYASLDSPRLAIDRKQSLLEVAKNVCQDHERFIKELKRAQDLEIRLIFLVEHSRNIRTLSDVRHWKNPRNNATLEAQNAATSATDAAVSATAAADSAASVDGAALMAAVEGKADVIHTHGGISHDGKVGITPDRVLVTGAGGLVVAQTMEEAIHIWKFTNDNLLINWDWHNPINQRGLSGPQINNYPIDRWRVTSNAAATVLPGRIEMTPNCRIYQEIEGDRLFGKTLTASIRLLSGTILSATFVAPPTENDTATGNLPGFGQVWLTNFGSNARMLLINDTSETQSVSAVKLEIGSASTLAYTPPMNTELEMVKCRKFGIRLNEYFRLTYANANVLYFELCIGHKLRISQPTITVNSFTVYSGIAPITQQSGFSVGTLSMHENVLTIRMTKTSHGLTDGVLQIDAFVSAEL